MSAHTRRALGLVVILSILAPAPGLGRGDRSATESGRTGVNEIASPSARLIKPAEGTDADSRIRAASRDDATVADEPDDSTPLEPAAPPMEWCSTDFDESGALKRPPRFSHRIDAGMVRLERLLC